MGARRERASQMDVWSSHVQMLPAAPGCHPSQHTPHTGARGVPDSSGGCPQSESIPEHLGQPGGLAASLLLSGRRRCSCACGLRAGAAGGGVRARSGAGGVARLHARAQMRGMLRLQAAALRPHAHHHPHQKGASGALPPARGVDAGAGGDGERDAGAARAVRVPLRRAGGRLPAPTPHLPAGPVSLRVPSPPLPRAHTPLGPGRVRMHLPYTSRTVLHRIRLQPHNLQV
ncbi:hypothetical protein JTE90_010848 [Oedothorax gibbosus]|uniref:Uncharacterized protein n=1 Tax=Oedothorax gibbosus TaxID=931172 RepID=A0AAV6V2T2_9ARAC|nr:hypothetical protein JTE90_010848 [Oedothorax gibbosus]